LYSFIVFRLIVIRVRAVLCCLHASSQPLFLTISLPSLSRAPRVIVCYGNS